MANAYKCDRCGKLYGRPCVPNITVVEYYHGYGGETKDLCPECQAFLEKWLKEYKKEDNGK